MSAKVEERHVEAAEETLISFVVMYDFERIRDAVAQTIAITEAAARADERRRVVEECCAAVKPWDQAFAYKDRETGEPINPAYAIRRALGEEVRGT